jgi:predicted SnoaL-like aldol condensation-catalyzing enzyme
MVSLAPPSPAHTGAAPVDVAQAPDALALLDDPDPVLARNKHLVFDMWRSIVDAGHVELADEMLQPGYIQHSPVLPTGRESFKKIFSAVPRRDIPPLVSPPLVTILAEGDHVVMVLREELPQPGGDGHYATGHFNLFRIEDGRLAEHWHSVQQAPGPNVLAPGEGGPQRVVGATGDAQPALLSAAVPSLAANKKLVFDAWRETMEAGRPNLADRFFGPDYIEHDPNGVNGLAGVKSQIAQRPKTPIAPALRQPLVAVVAQGDLVVLVTALEHPHPFRPGETYTTTRFDMFRIDHGRIAEHWDGSVKPGTPMPRY